MKNAVMAVFASFAFHAALAAVLAACISWIAKPAALPALDPSRVEQLRRAGGCRRAGSLSARADALFRRNGFNVPVATCRAMRTAESRVGANACASRSRGRRSPRA